MKQAAEVALLFAHIGLAAVDAVARERHGQAHTEYKARATVLLQSEAQAQILLTRFCLATRLNCLACYLPTAISQPALGSIDELLIALAGCAGEASSAHLTAAVQGRTRSSPCAIGGLSNRDVSPCPTHQPRGDR